MAQAKVESRSAGYQFFMLVLCIYALAVLAVDATVHLKPQVKAVFDYADFAVCGIFFVDFLISFWAAPNRWQYFVRWGWIDLLSSIPALEVARWGRLARIVRVFRVLRGLRATRIVTTVVLRQRAENSFLAASIVAVLLIVFCSVAILQFETSPESNITTAGDAIWWAFATITTVGYGDRYPVTAEGRFVAVVLMGAGVGLFSIFSGFLAAWFVAPESEATDSEVAALREDVGRLRNEIMGLKDYLQTKLEPTSRENVR